MEVEMRTNQRTEPAYKRRADATPEFYPGKVIISELMEPRNLNEADVAKASGLDARTVSDILHGKRSITAETATRFADCFETSPMFFMNLQALHDLRQVKLRLRGEAQG